MQVLENQDDRLVRTQTVQELDRLLEQAQLRVGVPARLCGALRAPELGNAPGELMQIARECVQRR